jgi:hypothetical protein
MKNRTDQERAAILPEIERSDEELRQAVGELQIAVKRGVDPRVWIAERPLVWALGAFFVGLWFGMRTSRAED